MRRVSITFRRDFSSSPRLAALREKLRLEDSQDTDGQTKPSLPKGELQTSKTFAIETYGCQMNVSDSEIVRSILLESGWVETESLPRNTKEAVDIARGGIVPDLTLINTCAIREKAEQKIWDRLHTLKHVKNASLGSAALASLPGESNSAEGSSMVGILGCMAERLKEKLLEDSPSRVVDLVVGPDSYRDLPPLLDTLRSINEPQTTACSTQLSVEETYADVAPVRAKGDGVGAFVSVMRGCNNMCSYCVVPFTRGRERSRPIESILNEVRRLCDDGYKEISKNAAS